MIISWFGVYLWRWAHSVILTRKERMLGVDAHEFNPSRHLNGKGNIKPAIADTKEESHGKSLLI